MLTQLEFLPFIKYAFFFSLIFIFIIYIIFLWINYEIILIKYQQAAFNGFVSCVRRLVQLGAKVNMQDETGETALHKAAFNGHVECCVACLDHGVDVNSR